MQETKRTDRDTAHSLAGPFSRRQRRAMAFPDDRRRAMYLQTRGSDYLLAKGANPLTGLITPSVDFSSGDESSSMGSRTPSPVRNSNPYPDLRPTKSRFSRVFDRPEPPPPLQPPRDDQFEALPLVVDDPSQPSPVDHAAKSAYTSPNGGQPLRGAGRRIVSQTHGIKPDDHLQCMNVPRRVQKQEENEAETLTSPRSTDTRNDSRSFSLPLLATTLHLTPPTSPTMGGEPDRLIDLARAGERRDVPRRKPVPPPEPKKPADAASKRMSFIALFDKLPRLKLVHPSQASTPKSLRVDTPFAYKLPNPKPPSKKAADVEIDSSNLLFWLFIGWPGMLIWELFQVFRTATSPEGLPALTEALAKPELRLKGLTDLVLLVLKLVAAICIFWYLYRVLLKVVEVILAVLWPVQILWTVTWSVARALVRRRS